MKFEEEKPSDTKTIVAGDQSWPRVNRGFWTDLPFLVMVELVVLGPKRLHSVLRHLAWAKAEFENARGGIKSQLAAEL
jgi:hypothetical protein